MESASDLQRTPLEEEHRALGAKLGAFAGWLMPIEYEGTLAEHRTVRERVGLFDLMHLGKITLDGDGALDTLQRTVTNDVARIPVQGAQYNNVLNDDGGIVDDVIVYRLGEDRYFTVPNAANTAKVHRALLENAEGRDVAVGLHDDWCFLAVQGPSATETVAAVVPEAAQMSYMQCAEVTYAGAPMILSRSGYTGEVGYEMFPRPEAVRKLWADLVSAGRPHGLAPIGLGARDTLRLEMGYPLHGQDIDESHTPLEAGLTWAVAFDKGEFRGRDALVRQKEGGVPRRLWGLEMEGKLIPRAHFPVFTLDGEPAGETTSGTFSPTLRRGIALAYLEPREAFQAGDRVVVEVRGRRGEAVVKRPPFVDRSPK